MDKKIRNVCKYASNKTPFLYFIRAMNVHLARMAELTKIKREFSPIDQTNTPPKSDLIFADYVLINKIKCFSIALLILVFRSLYKKLEMHFL